MMPRSHDSLFGHSSKCHFIYWVVRCLLFRGTELFRAKNDRRVGGAKENDKSTPSILHNCVQDIQVHQHSRIDLQYLITYHSEAHLFDEDGFSQKNSETYREKW